MSDSGASSLELLRSEMNDSHQPSFAGDISVWEEVSWIAWCRVRYERVAHRYVLWKPPSV